MKTNDHISPLDTTTEIDRAIEAAASAVPVENDLEHAASQIIDEVKSELGALKREIAELRRPQPPEFQSIDAGAAVGVNPLTHEALARMSAEQIARLDWADVSAALRRK